MVFVWSCSFCGKLILMLFIFYLIRKCNLIWRWWSGCVCVRVCVCACVLVCVQRVNRWAGDVRRQSDREREKIVLSLFLFLSLSFSPSWGTGFESECIVKQIDWLFFWRLRCRATCRLLRNQTSRNPSDQQFFHFKSCLSQQGFEIHLTCSSQIGISSLTELLRSNLAFQAVMNLTAVHLCPQISRFFWML